MTTFVDLVKANGFQSINDFLNSIGPAFADTPDFTERELKSIRKAEAATEAFLGATA